MPSFHQLEQLLAIAEHGTLTGAAGALHLSQPALSRSMQRLEDELRVTLFDRQKNRITLNQTGALAVEQARRVLDQLGDMVQRIRAFDRSLCTLAVGACAPSPLWDILPLLSALYPQMALSSELQDADRLVQGLRDNTYQIVVVPMPVASPGLACVRYGEEHLYFSLPPGHALAGSEGLHFRDLDGETLLLLSDIGFWHDVHLQKMPRARFIQQSEASTFAELVNASTLPAFTSDIVLQKQGMPTNRVAIPILDPSAHATYYCLYRAENREKLKGFLDRIDAANKSP